MNQHAHCTRPKPQGGVLFGSEGGGVKNFPKFSQTPPKRAKNPKNSENIGKMAKTPFSVIFTLKFHKPCLKTVDFRLTREASIRLRLPNINLLLFSLRVKSDHQKEQRSGHDVNHNDCVIRQPRRDNRTHPDDPYANKNVTRKMARKLPPNSHFFCNKSAERSRSFFLKK